MPVLRCNMFAVCNCKSRKDHNGNNPSMYIPGVYEKSFDGYLEMVSQYIRQYRILKLAIAYDEGNRVRNFNKSRAAAAYGQENPTEVAYRDFSIIILTSMQISAGCPLSAHRQLNDSCGKRWRLVEIIASSGAVIPGPLRKVTALFWHSVGWWRKCSQRCVRRATSAVKRPAIRLDRSGAAMRSSYLALKADTVTVTKL